MTQVGEGQDAAGAAPPMTTLGAPSVGEVLADRYELAEHINNDSAGRQVWRGVDVILRRPVAVVLRYPGGDSAMEMLQAAVTASRVVHPNLVGVYDAIDEHDRAYVVREWVEGAALREIVATGPLDAERSITIAHAVSAAVAAVHATGMVHGNVHPGTVLIDHDGRVVLADARGDATATPEADIRAVGGVLYFALTGHWPHAEAGRSALPDAVRDSGGTLASPRQTRAGVPDYVDELTVALLDPEVVPPSAETLAAELGRLDSAADEFFDESGPLRFADEPDAHLQPPAPAGRKIAVGVAALAVIALIALLIVIPLVSGGEDAGGEPQAGPANRPRTSAAPPGQSGDGPADPRVLQVEQVRVVDPKGRDPQEVQDEDLVVDGRRDSAWFTDRYNDNFKRDGFKEGMGILINLGEQRRVASVQVELSASGATAVLRAGTRDPGPSQAGDRQIIDEFQAVGEPIGNGPANMLFGEFDPNRTYQYLLVWITSLPSTDDGGYQIGIQEIVVNGS